MNESLTKKLRRLLKVRKSRRVRFFLSVASALFMAYVCRMPNIPAILSSIGHWVLVTTLVFTIPIHAVMWYHSSRLRHNFPPVETAEAFKSKWKFVASLFLEPKELGDYLDTVDELFEADERTYDLATAKFRYRVRALKSIVPLARWALRGALGIEAIRRLLR